MRAQIFQPINVVWSLPVREYGLAGLSDQIAEKLGNTTAYSKHLRDGTSLSRINFENIAP
jgi:hypothetical protein